MKGIESYYYVASINPIKEEEPKKPAAVEQFSLSLDNFSWTQNDENISINFKAIEGAETTADYHVKCESKRLEIIYKTETLVSSELFQEIGADLTPGSLQNNFLQFTLIKKDPALIWSLLIPGGPPENHGNKQNQHSLNSAPAMLLKGKPSIRVSCFECPEKIFFFQTIVSKEIKAEIGEIIFLSNFLAKRVKSQRGRN